MKTKKTFQIFSIITAMALTGCAMTPERQEALAGLFNAISAGANTTLQAQQVEQQQLTRFRNQAVQNQNDDQRRRQLQQLCMNPANRLSPLCLYPE